MNQPTFTVPQFCSAHGGISKSFLYKLIKDGRGPKILKIGRRTLISAEAAAEWRAKMEAATNQTEVAV